ncbi:DUF397 domain-containing protein [Streptomyces koyangensis]|uniref:DUF397 domain-containing protein n=1 Tax=Streptomyces koyangensis TaxID=188770 RepID=UPI0026C5515B
MAKVPNASSGPPEHVALTGQVLLRDSKTPHAPYLTLTPESFAGLVSLAKGSRPA